jgi:hypothetical protein
MCLPFFIYFKVILVGSTCPCDKWIFSNSPLLACRVFISFAFPDDDVIVGTVKTCVRRFYLSFVDDDLHIDLLH